jgi:hypothetical protein
MGDDAVFTWSTARKLVGSRPRRPAPPSGFRDSISLAGRLATSLLTILILERFVLRVVDVLFGQDPLIRIVMLLEIFLPLEILNPQPDA